MASPNCFVCGSKEHDTAVCAAALVDELDDSIHSVTEELQNEKKRRKIEDALRQLESVGASKTATRSVVAQKQKEQANPPIL